MNINIFLANNQSIFFSGIESIVENDSNIKLSGVFENKKEFLKAVEENNPDVVLFDFTYYEKECLALIKSISARSLSTKIIIISEFAPSVFIKEFLGHGVSGIILKDHLSESLAKAIYKVVSGKVFLPPSADGEYSIDDKHKTMKEAALLPILQTKLHPPQVYSDQIIRSAIIKKLEDNLEKPISLISAPAGYGKSQTVGQWINQTSAKSCWISLDHEHNSLRVFLTYLVSTINKMMPGVLQETLLLVSANDLPPVNIIAFTLINELDEINEDFILVLDDYHRIKENDIHELLNLILTYPPQKMHISVLTRRDPPLKLNNLLIKGRMVEVRMRDLAFTEEEIVALFENLLSITLNQRTIKSLKDKTEGWIVALRTASFLIKDNEDVDDILSNFHGDFNTLTKYLLEEVLIKQPLEYQELLLKVSALNRFSVELIDQLIEESKNNPLTGNGFIQWLLNSNLFVISLDTEGNWYRLHHLIQGFLFSILKDKYGGRYIQTIHSIASNWFYSKGFLEEAVQHALKSDKPDISTKYIEDQRHELMSKEQFTHLGSLMKLIPEEMIEKHCGMLISMAYFMEFSGQVMEMISYCNKAQKLLDDASGNLASRVTWESEIGVLNGLVQMLYGEIDKVIENASKSVKGLPENALHQYSYAVGEEMLAYQMKGNIDEGLRISENLSRNHGALPPISQARMQLWLCMAYWMEGHIDIFKVAAKNCVSLGQEYGLEDSTMMGKYFLACGHYIQNDLNEAKEVLLYIFENPYSIRSFYLAQSAYLLASIYIYQGNKKEAIKITEKQISIASQKNDASSLAIAAAFLNELSIEIQDKELAKTIKVYLDYNILPPMWFYYVPQLTPLKLLFAKNTIESLNEAEQGIIKLDDILKVQNKNTVRVDLLVLYALVLNEQNRKEDALDKLSEALSLSAKGKFIRPYLDYGKPLEILLKKLASDHVYRNHIDQILVAFKKEKTPPKKDSETALTKSINDHKKKNSHLSRREIDVLKLLADGYRNKEIAEKLFVSEGTVKKHVYNVGQRWDLHNRINIIQKAKDLNYI